jgi:type IX secretion system PorP/SprF family membrane protein
MLRIKLLALCVVLFSEIKSQDRAFSQFYSSPLSLNPALTGSFEGRYRVSSIYRDQWGKAMDNPYQTFSSAIDVRWRISKKASQSNDKAAVGLLFFTDRAGILDFSTTQISVSGAFHKALDNYNAQFLSIGYQIGASQRNLNYGDVTFEDQFNGTTGYTDPTSERFPDNNFAFADMSVGLNYAYSPRYSGFRLYAGAAMHHFLTPSVSFFKREDPESAFEDYKLYPRYSAQLSAVIPGTDYFSVLPRVIFDKQGPHMKLDAGVNFRVNASEFKNSAFHLGTYLRPVYNFDNTVRVDALVALVGFEFNNVLLGLSYDINLGRISNFNRRAFEISVAYLGEYEDELILCPKF